MRFCMSTVGWVVITLKMVETVPLPCVCYYDDIHAGLCIELAGCGCVYMYECVCEGMCGVSVTVCLRVTIGYRNYVMIAYKYSSTDCIRTKSYIYDQIFGPWI